MHQNFSMCLMARSCVIYVPFNTSPCCIPVNGFSRFCIHRSQTAPKDKLWLDLEKTAMNPFSETKPGTQMGSRQRRQEEARGHWYESQLGERWARALYSYYNWRTVSTLWYQVPASCFVFSACAHEWRKLFELHFALCRVQPVTSSSSLG